MKRITDDHPLRAYLATLSVQEQHAYCHASGTKLGYVRKFLSCMRRHNRQVLVDVRIVAGLVANSRGCVPFDSLRPDVDWTVVRTELERAHRRSRIHVSRDRAVDAVASEHA